MAHKLKTISKNGLGHISYCESCKTYHLNFNNLFLEFSQRELVQFQKYVCSINIDYWESKYECMPIERKIPIQTQQQNLKMIFNKQEIRALKDLLLFNTKKPNEQLSILDIDYTLFMN